MTEDGAIWSDVASVDEGSSMQSLFRMVACSLIALLIWAGPAQAAAEDQPQFDLICKGTVDSTTWNGPTSAAFSAHFRLDLKKNAFCGDEYCGTITRAGNRLEYHCKVGSSHSTYCGPITGSTAGPFVLKDDFALDRSTGSYHRTSSGSVGDLGPRPFSASYSGTCVESPFTGLTSKREAGSQAGDTKKPERKPNPTDGLDVGATPLTTLHSFAGEHDGTYPKTELIAGPDGTLYGTAGGDFRECTLGQGCGSVFRLSPPGKHRERWGFQTLYIFKGGTDGSSPSALTFGPDGALYGVVAFGGMTTSPGWSGAGVVFRLVPPKDPKSSTTPEIIYTFRSPGDGRHPVAALAFDQTGVLYGTCWTGPQTAGQPADYRGIIFRLTPPTNGQSEWSRTSLHRTPDQVPDARLLIDKSGALYGAGTKLTRDWSDKGEIYKLAPKSGSGEWEWSTIHKFSGPDGFMPKGALVMDKAGAIYGTTSSGGEGKCWEGCGTVFKLTPSSDTETDWRLTVLYKFNDQDHGLVQPQTGVVLGNDGSIYGAASGGGTDCRGSGCGGLFKLSPPADGVGAWTMSALYIFHEDTNDGHFPDARVLIDRTGTLYGTTTLGGLADKGTVFKLRQP